MTAFDTDLLSDIFYGRQPYSSRASAIPPEDQAVPLIVLEEILRGRFDFVRKAQASKNQQDILHAYGLLYSTVELLAPLKILPYTAAAHALYQQWTSAKIKVRPMDKRIAAIALAHSATLVTRNARDFKLIPGLSLDIWT
jgi:tRNA(fMet)-specific endonuclease VapC